MHVIRADNDIELTLSNWPTDSNYANMKLIITADGTTRLVTISSQGGGNIKTDGNVAWTSNILEITSATAPVIVEAFSYDGGVTVYLRYLGQFS